MFLLYFFFIFCIFFFFFFFFFSSRRRHTRSLCDWSSDVCSSDLLKLLLVKILLLHLIFTVLQCLCGKFHLDNHHLLIMRSEERRVGKECRSRWWRYN